MTAVPLTTDPLPPEETTATPPSMIADLPDTERPRERLLENGAGALNDTELVAVMLRTGKKGQSVISMSREILAETGGLAGLVGLQPRDLLREGLREAKAATLLAAVELARRLSRKDLPQRDPLGQPSEVARYLTLRYRLRDQEVMGALFLDVRGKHVADKELYRGTLSRAAVEPREVLKEALRRGAAGVVLFHTHPSGDPSPSPEDLSFTRRMSAAADVVGVRLIDHMILGASGSWVSLRERGGW